MMKKIFPIVMFLAVFCMVHPAYSYIDVNEIGDAEATAGEQNSNLYRLNAQGILAIKRLKKVDDAVARGFKGSDIDDLLASDAEQQEKQELVRLTKELEQKIANPKSLKVGDVSTVYAQIREFPSDARDMEVVKNLRNTFGRRF